VSVFQMEQTTPKTEDLGSQTGKWVKEKDFRCQPCVNETENLGVASAGRASSEKGGLRSCQQMSQHILWHKNFQKKRRKKKKAIANGTITDTGKGSRQVVTGTKGQKGAILSPAHLSVYGLYLRGASGGGVRGLGKNYLGEKRGQNTKQG